MQDVARFMVFGTATAVAVGALIVRFGHVIPTWVTVPAAILVVAASARLWGVQWPSRPQPVITATPAPPAYVDPADTATMPRHGSRRWARACYHNGVITLYELVQFYVDHPESLADPDR